MTVQMSPTNYPPPRAILIFFISSTIYFPQLLPFVLVVSFEGGSVCAGCGFRVGNKLNNFCATGREQSEGLLANR